MLIPDVTGVTATPAVDQRPQGVLGKIEVAAGAGAVVVVEIFPDPSFGEVQIKGEVGGTDSWTLTTYATDADTDEATGRTEALSGGGAAMAAGQTGQTWTVQRPRRLRLTSATHNTAAYFWVTERYPSSVGM